MHTISHNEDSTRIKEDWTMPKGFSRLWLLIIGVCIFIVTLGVGLGVGLGNKWVGRESPGQFRKQLEGSVCHKGVGMDW